MPWLVRAYLRELSRFSKSHQRKARQVLGHLGSELRRAGKADVRRVTEEDVVRYIEALSHLSLGTRRSYLGVVRGFFGSLVRRSWLLTSPAQDVALPAASALPRRVPSEAEVARFLSGAGAWRMTAQRDLAILEVLYGSGLRRSECARLDLVDVDLGEATLWVRDGKGKKDRVVPLTLRAVSALAVYLRENRPALARDPREAALFLSKYGGRLTCSSLSRAVHTVAMRTDLDLSAHSLRHACATHLLRGGADVRHIQKLLGHARLSTTSIYTHVTDPDLKKVFARAHPREKRRGPRRAKR
jgi:integrase/recombinase XerD